MHTKKLRIFYASLIVTAVIVAIKYLLHDIGGEVLVLGSLHSAVVSGTFFVVGFLLSATIADYKESERIPPEFASVLENMYEDAKTIKQAYPNFDLEAFRTQLHAVAVSFARDVRRGSHKTRLLVHALNESYLSMEQAKVPANYIVKFKTQQALLVKHLFRVGYIQNITFIPSATILVRSIVPLTVLLIVFTEVEPFYGGLLILAIISFILVYMLQLIQVISTPFQEAGKTQDDVSLYLVDEAAEYLKNHM